MFCDRCGTAMNDAAGFCPSCGKPAQQMPLMPSKNRIAGHIRLLGIFWVALSAFRLLPGVVVLAMLHYRFPPFFAPELPEFVRAILHFAAFAFLAIGAVGIAAGWGLLERQPWARMLSIVLGCLNLLDMPLGTALGIYTLWVLLPAESEEEYRKMALAA